jgi:hypothetical protein
VVRVHSYSDGHDHHIKQGVLWRLDTRVVFRNQVVRRNRLVFRNRVVRRNQVVRRNRLVFRNRVVRRNQVVSRNQVVRPRDSRDDYHVTLESLTLGNSVRHGIYMGTRRGLLSFPPHFVFTSL